MSVGAILGSLGGALRGGGVKPSRHLDVHTDLTRLTIAARDAVPLPARRRLPRRDPRAASSPTCPTRCSLVYPSPARPATAGDHVEGDVGDVGADAVDAPLDQLAHPRRVVARPGVDLRGRRRGTRRRVDRCSSVDPRVQRRRGRARPASATTSSGTSTSATPCGSSRRAATRQRSIVSRRNDEISQRSCSSRAEQRGHRLVGDASRSGRSRARPGRS